MSHGLDRNNIWGIWTVKILMTESMFPLSLQKVCVIKYAIEQDTVFKISSDIFMITFKMLLCEWVWKRFLPVPHKCHLTPL